MKFMFGLQHPLTCNPSTTLSNPCNKARGKYICKEVFLRYPSCIWLYRCELFYIYMCMYVAVNLHMWLYNTHTSSFLSLFVSFYSLLHLFKFSLPRQDILKPKVKLNCILPPLAQIIKICWNILKVNPKWRYFFKNQAYWLLINQIISEKW